MMFDDAVIYLPVQGCHTCYIFCTFIGISAMGGWWVVSKKPQNDNVVDCLFVLDVVCILLFDRQLVTRVEDMVSLPKGASVLR